MFGEFPMGQRWAAQLLAAVLPLSKVRYLHLVHRDTVAAQLVRAVMMRGDRLDSIVERVLVSYAVLDQAFDRDPQGIAEIVDGTFERLGELQEREFSLEGQVREARQDDLETKFGSHLNQYEFTYERYYRTLAAPYAVADGITRTSESVSDLIDTDGRTTPSRILALEAGRGIKSGFFTAGLDRHLRNAAAHHHYSILGDDGVRLWDVSRGGQYTWGPVEWRVWDLRTRVYELSNTCSVLLLGLATFDISHGTTIRARRWGKQTTVRPKRRDIVKSELGGMAALHGFTVDSAKVDTDGALLITISVTGKTVIEQTTQIVSNVGGEHGFFRQQVRTEWGPLRNQVYGFLQMTFDAHGGYDVVRVSVVAKDGTTSLGQVEAPLSEREAMIHGKERVEAIRARLPVDTLVDEKIPIILKDPIVPVV